MGVLDLLMAAATGGVCLAVAAILWALAHRRAAERRFSGAPASEDGAWADAFDIAVIAVEKGEPALVAGDEAFAACAQALGSEPTPEAVIAALSTGEERLRLLTALFETGEPCDFQSRSPKGAVLVQGRALGAVAWLKLAPSGSGAAMAAAESNCAAFFDTQPGPAWITTGEGKLIWANQAWLTAMEADSVEDAAARNLVFDAGAQALVGETAASGQRREALRWVTVHGRRRAFHLTVNSLPGGGVGASALDVTETEELREALKRHEQAHDETLNRLADAVAIFSPDKRLSFFNIAFAELWGLEPAWLADKPTHGEILDRLRQRRRLPETADYGKLKAEELSHYEDLGPSPDDLWTLPDGRTLRVVRQPHPLGGLLLLFSDVTGELRLKAQYNGLIQVQQATLDKLNDAVAVFGSDGRLRLHNEAFERFWGVSAPDLAAAGDFDGVVELCVHRIHDLQFWRELKARVGDPGPEARVPVSGETRTSDRRIIAFQSRPLPDGATLLAFTDITDTRELERALADRSSALSEAERLKREFVGNVSYELRTPLTTIIGYSELLDSMGTALPDRARAHIGAVRTAATQLARSIDDVLDMALIDANEMALSPGDVDLEELLVMTAESWRDEADPAEVTLRVECKNELGVIRADPKRLTQMLDHLIDNALRQSPPEGVVTLAARRAQNEVQIVVSDTGRGIPFHVQAHIFDRFGGRDRGGPGLGLALVKAMVELHGGWIALESEPGKGAAFTLHLPETMQINAGQSELQF
ncbi:MAG: PAS-domain containing protein [Acetobacteraceae bacterium]|nr:PAS-domain containing protein [Acetobacteraceae bacterium]